MTAIKVENLSKSYLVGHNTPKDERYTALRDVITRNVKGFVRKSIDMTRGRPIIQGDELEEFWALKDINFEIKQGDRLGIIGRNGAGKSTLLKVLSRITEPTTGRVTINGRVASLLEVGTGFHPELTGRENIFLNGAILGMSRKEIQRKFDEIVDFAEVEKFLDTPVKRYSSGMYVRLAFSVAAHLEPEILVVDEVLAVGDRQFQNKCLGKMQDVSTQQGRTVLFVSHNLEAVRKLCVEGIVLINGTLLCAPLPISDTIEKYEISTRSNQVNMDLEERTDRNGNGDLRFSYIKIFDEDGRECDATKSGDYLEIQIGYHAMKNLNHIELAIAISTIMGTDMCVLISLMRNKYFSATKGTGTFSCFLEKLPLPPGNYSIRLFARSSNQILDWVKDAYILNVGQGNYYEIGTGLPEGFNTILVDHYWRG